MTQTSVIQPRTVLDVLCGTDDNSQQAAATHVLAPALRARADILASVPEALRPAAASAVAAAAAGLLGFAVIELVLDGWRRHRDLIAAARRTLAVRGTTELVHPPDHTITVTRQPSVSVLVNGKEVAKVELDLALTFNVSILVAEVSAGKLTVVRSGHCLITTELSIHGVEILTRSAEIALPGTVSLNDGLRLLPEDDYSAQTKRPTMTKVATSR